jgi:branched-chain amino acid transport system ATP-binding protein
MAADSLLAVKHLVKSFGGLRAVANVSFAVNAGQIKAIIGPNGAGKTTLFNVISGILPPTLGNIILTGEDISHLAAHAVARRGISRTFQTVNLFGNMTALENVMVGRHCRTRAGMVRAALHLQSARREERGIREAALERLRFVGLESRYDAAVSSLSFKEQRLVEFARALATEPRLLLVDEPAAGLNVQETREIAALIRKIRDSGVTLLLVEHDMSLVMDISDEVLVLNYGQKIAEGVPTEIQRNEEVIAVYLGEDFQALPRPSRGRPPHEHTEPKGSALPDGDAS